MACSSLFAQVAFSAENEAMILVQNNQTAVEWVNAALHAILPRRALLTEEQMQVLVTQYIARHGFQVIAEHGQRFSGPQPFTANLSADGKGWIFTQPNPDEICDYLNSESTVEELLSYLTDIGQGVRGPVSFEGMPPTVQVAVHDITPNGFGEGIGVAARGGTPQLVLAVAVLVRLLSIEAMTPMVSALSRELDLRLQYVTISATSTSSQEGQEGTS